MLLEVIGRLCIVILVLFLLFDDLEWISGKLWNSLVIEWGLVLVMMFVVRVLIEMFEFRRFCFLVMVVMMILFFFLVVGVGVVCVWVGVMVYSEIMSVVDVIFV